MLNTMDNVFLETFKNQSYKTYKNIVEFLLLHDNFSFMIKTVLSRNIE
jgi:hypothetical protein